MALLPTSLDYSNRDKAAIQARVFTLIRQVFPTWTDVSVANFGNMLVEAFALIGDVLNFYQDNQAGESRLLTATQRQNVIALAALIGYRPTGQTAAQVTQTFQLPAAMAGDVVVPIYTTVKTGEITGAVEYQTQAELTFTSGQTLKTVLAENSVAREYVVQSSGLPDQSVALPASPFLEGSLVVEAGNGAFVWAGEINNFTESDGGDQHWVFRVDDQDRATILFGNGSNGAIPTGLITLRYKTGGGRAGRVEAGKLNKLPVVFYDSFGTPALLTTYNEEPSTPAADRESNALIKLRAPAFARAQRRSVSREDYETAAMSVSGVARALCLTINELDTIDENRYLVYVVPSGGGQPSDLLLEQVAAVYAADGAYPKTTTVLLDVRAPVYLEVEVAARLYFTRGANKSSVRAAAAAAVEAYFQIELDDGTPNDRVNFGFYYQGSEGVPLGSIAWSDVQDLVRDVPGVARVQAGPGGFTLNGVRDDLPIPMFAFPVLVSFQVVDAETGLEVL